MGPELRTELRVNEGLVLRTFRESDADGIYSTVKRNYEHLKPYMHWATPDYTVESAREFIGRNHEAASEKKSLGYGIFKNDSLIGSIGFVKFDWIARKTEIGYWIDQADEGKGIVSASCRELIEYAFNELHLNRVEIRCAAANLRSSAIPERLGFQKEGVLRQSEIRNGQLQDFNIYGLLADEWAQARLEG